MPRRTPHKPTFSKRIALGCAAIGLLAPLTATTTATAAAEFSPTANAAAPQDSVTLNLLSINDFHGRIDENTVAFAGTVEKLRAESGDANTLFLSAGDNIGASLFASAVQGDVPTMDVLNALGMDASAAGNHEFDKGYDDLTGRVADHVDFPYLGANVYHKGTQDPALPAYEIFSVQGVDVGVIGAVTQATPTLVLPDGVAMLDFGDPVQAVNRVANNLTDGQVGNGEADVLVASYHEGAPQGADRSTLDEQVANGGPFADIVTQTSPKVDVIFNGHTHTAYAWDGDIPGPTPGTRPIVQTGSYGENVGQVLLTVEQSSGDVVSYQQKIVPRLSPPDTDGDGEISESERDAFYDDLATTYPAVKQVRQIVQDALAHAAEVGNQPVGEITASITTAFFDTNNDGEYTRADRRDDRSEESTLGDLVGNMLRARLSPDARGGAEIGITNPGGLRAEMFYQGDTSDNPENKDGVVTYAEALAVLPFSNRLMTLTLTGAQFKTVLEQQWQPASASDPYLQLGLSENVTYTFDAGAPRGEHITSVMVNGEPLDPDAEYRIGTFSFLAQGGDNFTEFAEATNVRDSGLLDREAWIAFLKNNVPLSPDFARQSVQAEGLPQEVQSGGTVEFNLAKLDMHSVGSPDNTTVDVAVRNAQGNTTSLGSFPVNDGAASVKATLPAGLAAGSYTLVAVASPSGTTVQVPLTVTAAPRTDSTVLAHATPGIAGWFGPLVLARVRSEDHATGTIEVLQGDRVLATGRVHRHRPTLLWLKPDALEPGRHELTVRYSGDDDVAPSQTTVHVRIFRGFGGWRRHLQGG